MYEPNRYRRKYRLKADHRAQKFTVFNLRRAMICMFFLVLDDLSIQFRDEAINGGLDVGSRRVRIDFVSKCVDSGFSTVRDLIDGKHDMHGCNAVVMAFNFGKFAFHERTQMCVNFYVVPSDI